MAPLSPRAAAAYLAARTRFGVKLGLATIRALCGALGDPQSSAPVLLVAGTNGKGSVVAYAEAGLRAAGLRTGRYVSPHLVRVNERIAVGARDITDAAFARAVGEVREAAQRLVRAGTIPAHPTYFEVVTAAAFVHFRRAKVEVLVLEVGLGGRLDATNVTEPLVSAVVTVERDHQEHLGRTLARIAREKAGILRPGRAAVIGLLPDQARAVVREEAARIGARVVAASEDTRVSAGPAGLEIATPDGRYRGVRALPGLHQHHNLAVAVRLVEEAARAGLRVDVGAAVRGMSGARWPGRLQRMAGRPALLLDGAHNAAGARALAAALRHEPPFVLLFGVMVDKDVATLGATLFPLAREVVLTRAPGQRAAAPAEIARRVGAAAARAVRVDRPARALAEARRLAGPNGLVVVAGSLYLVGDVLGRVRGR